MKVLVAALLLLGVAVAAKPPASQVNNASIIETAYPQTLAEFGFFIDGAGTKPAPGVIPYRLNTPLWSDGAVKSRFLYLPPGTKAKTRGEGLLELPVGAALIKSFAFGGKLIETRVLLHRADGWVALPYVWNAEQTEAKLALAGKRIELTTTAGQAISYGVPNKNQCKECHGLAGQVTPIGLKAYNLSASWLTAQFKSGKLDAVPKVTRRIPLWEDRANVPVAEAARGYLDANCAHCHNPQGAASNSGLYLGWLVSDPFQLGVMKRPVAAGRGAGAFEFDVVPGEPDHSILYYRFASLEGGIAMPELGRESRDREAEPVIRGWIAGMR